MTEKENTWFNLAISAAIILVIFVFAGVTYAWLEVGNIDTFSRRLDAVYKFGIFGAGLVTFCTVVWRGLVSIRQATAQVDATNNQAEQIALTRHQIEIGERNELAKLFQKGVELLHSDKASERAAGISTLEVVSSTMKTFAIQALDQIVDRYQIAALADYNGPEAEQCRSVISATHKRTGLVSARTIKINYEPSTGLWRRCIGIHTVICHGGNIRGDDHLLEPQNWTNHQFENTKINGGTFSAKWPDFETCVFEKCNIFAFDDNIFTSQTFNYCNFSDAIFNLYRPEDLRGTNNYFISGHPPKGRDGKAIDPLWIDRNLIQLEDQTKSKPLRRKTKKQMTVSP